MRSNLNVIALATVACAACASNETTEQPVATADDFTVGILEGYSTAPFVPSFSPGVLRATISQKLYRGSRSMFIGGVGVKVRCDLMRTDSWKSYDQEVGGGQQFAVDAGSFRFFRQSDGRVGVQAPLRPYPADPDRRVSLTLACISGGTEMPTASLVEEALKFGKYNGFAFTASSLSDAGGDAH